MVNPIETGRRIKVLRGDIPREQMADDLEISVSAVSMYENGERVPRDEIKVRIADYFHRSVQEIFFDEECHI